MKLIIFILMMSPMVAFSCPEIDLIDTKCIERIGLGEGESVDVTWYQSVHTEQTSSNTKIVFRAEDGKKSIMRFPDEKNININGQQGYIKNYCKDGNFYIEKFVNGMESPSLIKGHSFQDFIYFYGEEIISSPSLTKKRYRYVCTTLVA